MGDTQFIAELDHAAALMPTAKTTLLPANALQTRVEARLTG